MARPKKSEPKIAPSSRFVGEGAFRVVKLNYPIAFNGQRYDEITVKRMTMAQLRAFIDALDQDGSPESKLACMVDCPVEVLDHLDPDDYDDVQKAIADFLPRRLKPDVVESESASKPANGETTPPPSSPNSVGDPPT